MTGKINKPFWEGGSIMWGNALSQNASYSRKLSYRSRRRKMAKAREGCSSGARSRAIACPTARQARGDNVTGPHWMCRRNVHEEPHPIHVAELQQARRARGATTPDPEA